MGFVDDVLAPTRDVSNAALPFMAVQVMNVGLSKDAIVARLTGELGYEFTVSDADRES
jgi:glycine cleavage system aminomethyltransferase T